MKTIKVIDLLNKIANKEELPKKIEYKLETFYIKYDTVHDIYFYEAKDGTLLLKYIYNTNYLLDEVEILEDNTEEIDDLKGWLLASTEDDYEAINATLDRFGKKINELVKAVNKLKENKEEK